MKKMHRDTDICSPVKCFKNLSFCRRSLGKTSVKRGEIPQVRKVCHIADQFTIVLLQVWTTMVSLSKHSKPVNVMMLTKNAFMLI